MKKIIAFIFLLSAISLFSQTTQNGDIVDEINSIISTLPSAGGLEYSAPTSSQITDWESMLTDLFAANYNNANTKAIALGYDLIAFTDTSTTTLHYLLKTTSGGGNYWGTYVYNPAACRSELVIMSPHSKKDLNTGKEGIYCYKTTDAFFFMLNGTNRCNQTSSSTCSGTTTVCSGGTAEAYRISDMAHVTNSIWQTTTQYLYDNFPDTYFAQLHGFTKKITDPYLIMSNGTRITPAPDKIVLLKNNLLLEDNTLTFKIAHIDLSWNRLIGFTNTNGRYINSSTDPCLNNATATSGRFLHIEQEKTKLRQDSTGWHKMASALANTFNANACSSVAPLPIELSHFSATIKNEQVLIFWQTLSELNNDFFLLEKSSNGIDFFEINRQQGMGNSNNIANYFYEDSPFEGVNYYRLTQQDFDEGKMHSPIISIFYKNKKDLKTL
ncbi:MAG TPA: hypothetical protein ENJ53_00885, partial [Phaeodactylibacter sp.]|nr:hypothetical protein [Phaeodactylibacter sp.]